jgi:diguanylate cyclase (GGDEF)-like protein
MDYKLVEFDRLLQEIQIKEPLEYNLEKIIHDMESELVFQSLGVLLKLPSFTNFELVNSRNLSESFKHNFFIDRNDAIIKKLLEHNSIILKDCDEFKLEKDYSELMISPLHYKKKLFGFFFIDKSEGVFTREEITKIEMFVSIISMQILIFMQQYEIEKLKKFDEVTGVYTNFSFMEQGNFLLTQMNRYHRYLTLILLKIEHYDELKKNKSQPVLDVLRRKITTALRSDLRESDIMGMIDESIFAILMPETSVSIIYQAVVRLNDVILQIPEMDGTTISWGISGKDEQTTTIGDLLKYATSALQESEAKKDDKITFY